MRIPGKPWVAGLIQAIFVFGFTLLLYFLFSKIVRLVSFPYRTVDPVIATTVGITAFIIAVIIYALVVFAYPVILASNKKVTEAIKTVIFTAGFLLMFFIASVLGIYFFAGKVTLINQGTRIYNPQIYTSKEELVQEAQESKVRSENARVEYEIQQNKKGVSPQVITITPENQVYPYVIDINTGEKTPINP